MDIGAVRFFNGSKFMWDNVVYDTKETAETTQQKYEQNKFEVQVVEHENKYLIYTRRVVTEVKVEGAPPP